MSVKCIIISKIFILVINPYLAGEGVSHFFWSYNSPCFQYVKNVMGTLIGYLAWYRMSSFYAF